MYLQSYYMNYGFVRAWRYNVCNACLFLASKAEEYRISLKDIITAQFILRRAKAPDRDSDVF